ncbi:nucleotide sugar dehydrogenase [Frankia sp. Cppng1_Ct_nod]|uniref:nucleotide sugar dehydrogenase n=1 Tax=Frankia sp. Cppng1_Ct_nod TaxID=2897162 RepID=UPI00202530D1|nr:nucleotide sugar dehydrogenase [Frankia sp. Cppng1_Ct_nod]
MSTLRIAVVGLWHLGCVTAASLAAAGYRVVGIDADADAVERLRDGHAPLSEPGLDDLLARQQAEGRLVVSASPAAARDVDIVWITHDVPVDAEGRTELGALFDDAETVIRHAPDAALFISAQVPVGTSEQLAAHCGLPLAAVVYIPENLRLGQALARFARPDVTVIGASDPVTAELARTVLAPFSPDPISCDLRSAEMAKHAINTFLATSISLANELGDIAAAIGADAHVIARVMRADTRIGPGARVVPGPPFAGGTLARDVAALAALGRRTGVPTRVVDAVAEVNDARIGSLVDLLGGQMSFHDARVALIGLVYTSGTDTLRHAPGLRMAEHLRREGADVIGYDPALVEGVERRRLLSGHLRLVPTALRAAHGADAVVILRPDAAAGLDPVTLADAMRAGGVDASQRTAGVVFDVWAVFEPEPVVDVGLVHLVPGRRPAGLGTPGVGVLRGPGTPASPSKAVGGAA